MNNDPLDPHLASASPPPAEPAAPVRGSLPGPPRRPEPKNTSMFGCLFAVSILLNVGAGLVLIVVCCGALVSGWGGFNTPSLDGVPLFTEKVLIGNATSKDKVAVISLDGVIMEGYLGFIDKQIEQAAKDKQVKAVVLRINSPGGSITASDDLHRRLTELAKGNTQKKYDAKTLVVSMGAMAASGGYYVAMPGETIFAEKTTMTGSIGVYAAFPNVAKLAKEHGFGMETIKAGDIKDSGSAFKEMSPEERQVWQDMINTAYLQFLDVVVAGRQDQKLTRDNLLEKFEVKPVKVGDKEGKPYSRNLADGGIWTADEAKKHKLIDAIGTLEDAVQKAHDLAKMGGDFKAVEYEKPKTPLQMLLGVRSDKPIGLNSPLLDPARLRNGLTPRVWFLAPGCEFAGMLAAVEAERN